MKRLLLTFTALLLLFVFFGGQRAEAYTLVQKNCVAPLSANTWRYEWQDMFSETLYAAEAPCQVDPGQTFDIVLTIHEEGWYSAYYLGFYVQLVDTYYDVSDTGYTTPVQSVMRSNDWFAPTWSWSCASITGGGSFNVECTKTISVTYPVGSEYNHKMEYKFKDLGHGSGSHWGSGQNGTITGYTVMASGNSAPVVNAGPDLYMAIEDQYTTIIAGTATDADAGDILTYRWLEGGVELIASTTVIAGAAPFDLSFIPALSYGAHTLTLEVTDGTSTVTDDVIVNVSNTPPVVNAGPDFILPSEDQNITIINGTATDPGGDAMTYRWLEGGVEVLALSVVDAGGNAPLDLSFLPVLSLGDHTFTLEVTDGINTVTDDVVVNIANTPPTVVAAGAGTYEVATDIALNGTVSDYDGDQLTYEWFIDTVSFSIGTVSTPAGGAPVAIPSDNIVGGLSLGSHLLILVVSDGIAAPVSSSVVVNVVDTTVPTLAPVSSHSILSPPDKKLVGITITANHADNSGVLPALSVSIVSSEAEGATVDSFIINIDQATGVIDIQLRAERDAGGAGRTYTVTITATDASGNFSTADVIVTVPVGGGGPPAAASPAPPPAVPAPAGALPEGLAPLSRFQ
ncbi:MAG: hypothetical protein V3T30_06935 [Thermodesulfobacteriota bacterium]